MRIERLDLTRYGRFSDYSIDFGARPDRGLDFHVIYGLNEAGKSTAAAAILDLLFGIEERSAYGAAKGRASAPGWHAYGAMRVGARIELKGSSVELARLKRDKASLVDKDNLALDEALLGAELAGVDREAFRMMFSLDDESLEKGGEAILASRGDLGQLLFSASAGLAEMSGRLDALRERAGRFYRRHGKITELAEKKRALDELKAEREKLDTLASTYAGLVHRRDEARTTYEAAVKALAGRRARAEAVRRLLAGLPHLAALGEAERRLQPLVVLVAPPAGWADETPRLEAERIRLTTQGESAEAALKSLEDELAQIDDDAPALAIAARVEGWRELRSRYDAARDISARQGELDGKRAVIADTLRRLGREGEPDPRDLLLPARAVGALEDLIVSRSGVESKLAAAREAAETARDALADAIGAAPSSEEESAGAGRLKSRLAEARRDDSAARLRAARDEARKLERGLAETLSALKPWIGDPGALAAVAVPGPAETEALRARLSQATAQRDACVETLARRAREKERLEAEAAAALMVDLVDDAAAVALRDARDAAWRAHRDELTDATAGAFEAAMLRDDSAGAARLANARDLAAARERAVTLAGVEAERVRTKAELGAANRELSALADEIAALAPAAAPTGRDPLGFLEGWRAKRDEALALWRALGAAQASVRLLVEDGERARRALSEGLAAAGVAHDADAGMALLIEAAEAAIVGSAREEALRAKVKERRAEARRAERRLETAEEDDARWREHWRLACADSWLGEDPSPPSAGSMRQVLKGLEDLRVGLKECADLEHRIVAMERDRKAFLTEVEAVGATLGLAQDDEGARLADAVAARVAEARETRRRREEREAALAAARERRAAIAEALAVNGSLASVMTGFFGVVTLAEVAAKLEDCKLREAILAEVARETRAIVATGVAASFEASRSALEAADREALEQELADLVSRASADDAAHAGSYAAYSDAKKALGAVGGDDAVARIEEKRRTVLEEIKEGAGRYLKLRAGVAAADQALKLYRDRHRGAMMERASKAFSEISRGAYRGLAAQPNSAGETLIALGADGGSKSAEQLSKGARFQLYLALRVAGYHELARTRPPATFVADDIMETFDHFRAEEALRLFADMARVGQVIYLTHHLHLAEIAKRVCPETRVHQLPA